MPATYADTIYSIIGKNLAPNSETLIGWTVASPFTLGAGGPGGSADAEILGTGGATGVGNFTSPNIPVSPNTTYTFSCFVDTTGELTGSFNIEIVDLANAGNDQTFHIAPGTTKRVSVPITTGATASTVVLRFQVTSGASLGAGQIARYAQPQFELGGTATDYAPSFWTSAAVKSVAAYKAALAEALATASDLAARAEYHADLASTLSTLIAAYGSDHYVGPISQVLATLQDLAAVIASPDNGRTIVRPFLRPDQIDVWRRIDGAVGPTGNVATTPTKLYSGVEALVDHASRGVSDTVQFSMPSGEQVAQTDLGFIDGVMPQLFVGAKPGDTVVVDGLPYVVAPNGRGAFLDVQPFDVVVRGADRYLVLQATRYTDVFPVLQLHLNFGRAWQ